MAFFNDDELVKIKEQVDIKNLIEKYVPLKKRGRNYIGLCPFHNEKTPSFTVSQEKQIFHCFGCGKGGDIFTFIMEREGLNFAQAVEMIAHDYNIDVKTRKTNPKQQQLKKRFFQINAAAARFFYHGLKNHTFAQKYLSDRGLSPKTIARYGIGYADSTWDSLYTFLKEKGYTEKELLTLDLIGERKDGKGYYDKFRNRIIFPIINRNQQVIGFGARVLDESLPKYLNSSDTPVFHKRSNLYGLHIIAKESDRQRIILTEGYMDVISLYNHGIVEGVASLGTALTEEQCRLVNRFGKDIYIAYDSDDAGLNATLKAIEIFEGADIPVKVIPLPKGLDPDDFLKKRGKVAFEKLISEVWDPTEFKINRMILTYGQHEENAIELLQSIAKVISSLSSPIEREVYIDRYAKNLSFSKNALQSEVNLNRKKGTSQTKVKNKSDEKEQLDLMSKGLVKQIVLLKTFIEDTGYYHQFKQKLSELDFDEDILINFYIKLTHAIDRNELNRKDFLIELEGIWREHFGHTRVGFKDLMGPKNADETLEWILSIQNDELFIKREGILNDIQAYERGESQEIDIVALLSELKKVNQLINIRKSDNK